MIKGADGCSAVKEIRRHPSPWRPEIASLCALEARRGFPRPQRLLGSLFQPKHRNPSAGLIVDPSQRNSIGMLIPEIYVGSDHLQILWSRCSGRFGPR
jgi:hypothetical protein